MKLLWISNFGYNNSYDYVTETLLRALQGKYSAEYEIYLYCTGQTKSDSFPQIASVKLGIPKERIFYLKIHKAEFPTPEEAEFMKNHLVGVNHLKFVYQTVKPDVVISLNDFSPVIIQKQAADILGIPLIPYIPCDQHRLSPTIEMFNYKFPAVISPSKHSSDIYLQNMECPVYTLPHIIDLADYHQLPNRGELRKKWLGSAVNDDTFVVCAVNRNNVRKRLDILVEIFNQFAKDKSNVLLCLKTSAHDPEERFSSVYAPSYNLTQLEKMPKIKLITDELNMEELNEIYNIGNVGLTTTSGEGFGLTPCEMSLCKIPQLVPNHTSHPWLFGEDYPGLIPCKIYSNAVARSFLPLERINNDIIPIFKIFGHYKTDHEEVKEGLEKSKGIFDLLLTGDLEVRARSDIPAFTEITDLVEFIDKNIENYVQIQVLLHTNIEYIQKTDFTKLFGKRWELRKSYQVNAKMLESYVQDDGGAGIVDKAATIELLNKLYRNPALIDEWGEHCYNQIQPRFSKECVTDTMHDILSLFRKK